VKALGVNLAGLSKDGPQPIVLLLKPTAKRGSGSVVVRQAGDNPCGGLTIVNLAGETP
jgi:hypothetical protein